MSLFNSYDRTQYLGETNSPLDIGSGVVTPAKQKANILANLGIAAGGLGYAPGLGIGGVVTQLTSRTTGVTINKLSGAITMFAAIGSATPASFVVTDSQVAITDIIDISVQSASNSYLAYVSQVAAGSFTVTFESRVGTASDSPVLNFNVIKGTIT